MTTATKELKTRDQFGSLEGSKPAQVNAQLSYEWQRHTELCKAAGLRQGYDDHTHRVQKLAAKGLIEMSEVDGVKYYRLNKPKVAKKPSKKKAAKTTMTKPKKTSAKAKDTVASVEEFNAA